MSSAENESFHVDGPEYEFFMEASRVLYDTDTRDRFRDEARKSTDRTQSEASVRKQVTQQQWSSVFRGNIQDSYDWVLNDITRRISGLNNAADKKLLHRRVQLVIQLRLEQIESIRSIQTRDQHQHVLNQWREIGRRLEFFRRPSLLWLILSLLTTLMIFLWWYRPVHLAWFWPISDVLLELSKTYPWIPGWTFWTIVIAHIFEAAYAWYLCSRLNFSLSTTVKWMLQNFLLGAPSLSIIRAYANQTETKRE